MIHENQVYNLNIEKYYCLPSRLLLSWIFTAGEEVNPLWTYVSKDILARFLPFCVPKKFWERPNSSEILAVLKLPTAKIYFIGFLQTEAAFLKTNYIPLSYLPVPIDKQNMSEKKNFTLAAGCLIFIGIYS